MSKRDELLMALARSDGQPWADIADATRHAAEIMYGEQAGAVLAWLGEQFDEGLRRSVGKALHASSGCDCGGWFYKDADAAIAVVRERLGLSDAAQDAQNGARTASEVEGGAGCHSDASRAAEVQPCDSEGER